MPWIWKAGMVLLVLCLLASIAIAVVRLSTTPSEVLGDGFHGLPAQQAARVSAEVNEASE